jgi:hypothetical protein
MSDEDQLKLEKDLQAARAKQEAIAGQPDPGTQPPPPAKKAAAAKKQPTASASGDAKTSGAKTNP